ncbi:MULTISPECIES: RDD family protein [Arcobacteraceae]|uniref:RDD family protein n=1 Tax=Arcobacteraceae TaxID=2808963 RepID=UPI00100AA929|nr:RDD family protein [Arcobacter sp. CECT 8989]RXK02724.1 RDD family protein [Arcobacter sp. CECT 8989]
MNTDNLELASNRKRALAYVIDDFLVTFIIVVMFWDKIVVNGTDLVSVLAVMNAFIWQVLLLKFIYQTFFIWYYGATVGKIIAKVRVIDFNNFGRVSLLTSATRSVFRLFSEMFFYFGFIFAFFTESRQTLHDKVGRTLVVNA